MRNNFIKIKKTYRAAFLITNVVIVRYKAVVMRNSDIYEKLSNCDIYSHIHEKYRNTMNEIFLNCEK